MPKTEKTEPVEQLIYIGPNLPGGRLSQYTVFRGGLPVYLSDLLEQQPSIKELIVPVAETAATQAKTNMSGTPEYIAYQNLMTLRG
ncbi:hypothetical protein A7975_27375 [Bacillus sp. FJAT-26390]|nr:hypothetical protein A7975_27375 [Bacillus sp. FJAT-26390]